MRREWATVARNAHKRKRTNWAAVACLSAKQGLGVLYAESESVAIQCTLRRERERWGEEKTKVQGSVLLASYAKGGSGLQIKGSE